MGLYFGMRGSIRKNGNNWNEEKISEFDPNPSKFNITRIEQIGSNVVVMINYPNCKNYEGNKILVFKHQKVDEIKNLKEIDPHFTEEKVIKPFARFEPTEEGWSHAIYLSNVLI